MGGLDLRHNKFQGENKKAALGWAASGFEFNVLLGACGCCEPPRCVRVRGQQGQDDGNKRNKGDVEDHGEAQKLLIGRSTVNFSFNLYDTGRDKTAQPGR